MKLKVSMLMLLSGFLVLNAADHEWLAETAFRFKNGEIVTLDLIIKKCELSCKRKNATDALKWYCALELFIYADCKWLDINNPDIKQSLNQGQYNAWLDQSSKMMACICSISKSTPRIYMDIDTKVIVRDVLLKKIAVDQVQVDLARLLGGDPFPADAKLKSERIAELKKIRKVQKVKQCEFRVQSAFF